MKTPVRGMSDLVCYRYSGAEKLRVRRSGDLGVSVM